MYHRLLFIMLLAFAAAGAAMGQAVKDSVLINFRQSKVNIDPDYMQNHAAFNHIRKSVEHFNQPDSNFVLTDVKVIGGASPEGSIRFNEWLSRERAKRIYDYLNTEMILPDSITSHTLLGRDWEGLLAKVKADPYVPYRDDVITTLENIIVNYKQGEKESAGNLAALKRLHHGVPYLYLYRNIFPSLRESRVILTFDMPNQPVFRHPDIPLTINTVAIPDGGILFPVAEQDDDRPFYMALKTNMLYDLLAVPQGSIEFYLGKNMSIVGNWEYGWWDKDNVHRYWRIYGGDLALRWWFGKAAHEKPLTGHHLGIYGGVVTYDFEFGGKGKMGGLPGRSLWDRCNRMFGVEYGYSLPIARRLNIDFTIGIGYLGGKVIDYIPVEHCYMYQDTKKLTYFGPTKLEVSLTWLIGHGNFNKGKGGRK